MRSLFGFVCTQAIPGGNRVPSGAVAAKDENLNQALSRETGDNLVAEVNSLKADAASGSQPSIESQSGRKSSRGRKQQDPTNWHQSVKRRQPRRRQRGHSGK